MHRAAIAPSAAAACSLKPVVARAPAHRARAIERHSSVVMAAASVKFTYFDGRGHGQRIRYALAGAGLDWEEVLLTQPGSMDAARPECLFTQVPLLEIDGLKLVQSWAIVRYIATKDGLSPADQALADMWGESVRDYYQDAGYVSFGWGPDRKAAEEQIRASAARHLPRMEKALGGKPFTVLEDKPCWSDFQVLLGLDYLVDVLGEDSLKPYPSLAVLRASLRKLPSMQKFYASEFNKGLVTEAYKAEVRAAMSPKA